ncbi:hypothetical protein [Bradyrhizobium sp. SZCCHNS1054]|uniref:hypothetical protein n=1 Tax=Bradyrhizobium sp. SZCCHNS1054 TaxID=3057301 RepID=UPI00291685C5|nr:hypothetical protein [Bradyrhizobium sp. SZCCHNS1054]
MNHRWKAEVSYHDRERRIDVITFEEFSDLGNAIERGPSWNDIYRIVITYARGEGTRVDAVTAKKAVGSRRC